MAGTFTVTAEQGESLDALVWRVLGAGSGVVEQVYELNRDLAELGAVLPEGHEVILPVFSAAPVQAREMVQLWD